jgi:hypothetical protein
MRPFPPFGGSAGTGKKKNRHIKYCGNKNRRGLRLFQNPVGFETTSWKSGQMPAFPFKSKVAVPKTEVLEQPRLIKGFHCSYIGFIYRKLRALFQNPAF